MTRISAAVSSDYQMRLFDEPINSLGTTRVVLGNLVEDLTAKIFNGRRHKTDSRCSYCPDVTILEGVTSLIPKVTRRIKDRTRYLECKGSGKNGDVILYQGRLQKDITFAQHHELYYVVWKHNTPSNLVSTVQALQDLFLLSVQGIYVLHISEIQRLSLTAKQLTFTSRFYGSPEHPLYRTGYRIRIKDIQQSKHLFIEYKCHTPIIQTV